jgi:hypothetical protein
MSRNLSRVHWTKDALCKFDKKFTSFYIDDVNEAKSLCAECSVQIPCILANEDTDGSFTSAGLSKYDRLLIQWKRVENTSERNFGDSSLYVSVVMRREREAFPPRTSSE